MFGGDVLGKLPRCGCSTWTLNGCSSDSKQEQRRITSVPIWHHWKTCPECPPCSSPMTTQLWSLHSCIHLDNANLDKTHPETKKLLKGNSISVNRFSIPFSRNAVDITVEQTINKHAKSQGGNIGFSTNHSAYYRWCTTRHSRASSLQGTGAGRDGHYRKLFTQRCQTLQNITKCGSNMKSC